MNMNDSKLHPMFEQQRLLTELLGSQVVLSLSLNGYAHYLSMITFLIIFQMRTVRKTSLHYQPESINDTLPSPISLNKLSNGVYIIKPKE